MTAEQRTTLISEIRESFQIPPYQSDEVIGQAINKCYARLSFLYGAEFNPMTDQLGKQLLGNAVYYELYHRYEEFERAWQPNILSWQLGGEVPSE